MRNAFRLARSSSGSYRLPNLPALCDEMRKGDSAFKHALRVADDIYNELNKKAGASAARL